MKPSFRLRIGCALICATGMNVGIADTFINATIPLYGFSNFGKDAEINGRPADLATECDELARRQREVVSSEIEVVRLRQESVTATQNNDTPKFNALILTIAEKSFLIARLRNTALALGARDMRLDQALLPASSIDRFLLSVYGITGKYHEEDAWADVTYRSIDSPFPVQVTRNLHEGSPELPIKFASATMPNQGSWGGSAGRADAGQSSPVRIGISAYELFGKPSGRGYFQPNIKISMRLGQFCDASSANPKGAIAMALTFPPAFSAEGATHLTYRIGLNVVESPDEIASRIANRHTLLKAKLGTFVKEILSEQQTYRVSDQMILPFEHGRKPMESWTVASNSQSFQTSDADSPALARVFAALYDSLKLSGDAPTDAQMLAYLDQPSIFHAIVPSSDASVTGSNPSAGPQSNPFPNTTEVVFTYKKGASKLQIGFSADGIQPKVDMILMNGVMFYPITLPKVGLFH